VPEGRSLQWRQVPHAMRDLATDVRRLLLDNTLDDRVELARRIVSGITGPVSAQFQGKFTVFLAPGEDVDGAMRKTVPDHLQHKMGGGSKTCEPQDPATLQPGQPERPISDMPQRVRRENTELWGEAKSWNLDATVPSHARPRALFTVPRSERDRQI